MIEIDLSYYKCNFIYNGYIIYYCPDKVEQNTLELLSVLLDAVYYNAFDKVSFNSKMFKLVELSKFKFFQSVPGKFRYFNSIPDEGQEKLLL